jgi:isoleucyl-tRNA synthetase
MYQNLVRSHDKAAPESVHLCDWPKPDLSRIDVQLDEETRLVMRVASLAHSARSRAGIKVRQPVGRLVVVGFSSNERRNLEAQSRTLLDELNIKELAFAGDASPYIDVQVQLNKVTLGPRYGARLAELQELASRPEALEQLESLFSPENDEQVGRLGEFELHEGDVNLSIQDRPGFSHALDTKDVSSLDEGGIKARVVVVDTSLTPELIDEGLAREIVHRLQTMRRKAGFEIADRIVSYYQDGDDVRRVMGSFRAYICQETLSHELVEGEPPGGAYQEEQIIDGHKVRLAVRRA